jgi:hypothetical protein
MLNWERAFMQKMDRGEKRLGGIRMIKEIGTQPTGCNQDLFYALQL